ncbi:MAG: FKBP-type peptidyl-prolyl cis-trans isomerase [Myxococcota bacterium]
MRKTTTTIALASAIAITGCFQATAFEDGKFADDPARESYAMGVLIGQQLGQDVPDLEISSFIEGIGAALKGEALQLTESQIGEAVASYGQRQMETAQRQHQERAEKNTAAGSAYQEEFARQKDVVTLASGVQYQVIESGEGDRPGPDANVVVHYSGRLIDGSEFDSSYARKEPASFPLSRVIPGWTEVLQEMNVGAKWKVVVPPELAYGELGAGPAIEPNSTLVFDIELIEIS